MGNTLGGTTSGGGMMKTMKDMMTLATGSSGGSNDRDSGYTADKLPDGEKYFGFVNVTIPTHIRCVGLKHLLCELGPPGIVSLQALQAAGPLL